MAATATVASADPVQTLGSNITVTTCRAQMDKPQLTIGYQNVAPVAAAEVDFAVATSAGLVETVKDIGKFGSGIPIRHVYALPDGTSPLGLSSARCLVTKVLYADGTSWVNASPP